MPKPPKKRLRGSYWIQQETYRFAPVLTYVEFVALSYGALSLAAPHNNESQTIEKAIKIVQNPDKLIAAVRLYSALNSKYPIWLLAVVPCWLHKGLSWGAPAPNTYQLQHHFKPVSKTFVLCLN